MKNLYLILNWFFGVFFILIGFAIFFKSPLGGMCFAVMSFFLLPPIRNFLYSKTKRNIPVKYKAFMMFLFFMAFSVFLTRDINKDKEKLSNEIAQVKIEASKKIKLENIAFFNSNKKEILDSIDLSLEAKDYEAAISQSMKYLDSGDKDLLSMHTTAKNAIILLKKELKTKDLLKKLKTIPTSNYVENHKYYTLLSNLHPVNKKYKNKVKFYASKIEIEKQKNIAAEARTNKIKLQFSSWDGSHRNLETLIKNAMNDPDSYKHVETVYWDKGSYLIVRTTYRGKNAFGGVVKNFVEAKISLDGAILQILDET